MLKILSGFPTANDTPRQITPHSKSLTDILLCNNNDIVESI